MTKYELDNKKYRFDKKLRSRDEHKLKTIVCRVLTTKYNIA